MVGDTIGDFIIRLKNAGAVRKGTVLVPYSKFRHAVADKLAAIGYVSSVAVTGKKVEKKLEVTLAYDDKGKSKIMGVKRVSKPGRRLYAKVGDIYPVKFGHGNLVLSTPAGILTDKEAREANVGGERLFMIW